MIYTIVQIIIALILIALMGILAYGIYNKNARDIVLDAMKPRTVKKKTKIIDGVFAYDKKAVFNTTDASMGTYVDVNPSINQKGGAVYTYNFWLFMPESTVTSDDKTLTLFNKGSSEMIKYKSEFRCKTNITNSASQPDGWFLIKNPLVRVDYKSNKIEAIIVEFNSIGKPDVYHSGANMADMNCSSSDHVQFDQNLFGIKELSDRTDLLDKWNMITIVVSETTPEPNSVFVSENQVIVKLYLNGYQYLDKNGEIVLSEQSYSTAIKSNRGNLILNPGYKDNAVNAHPNIKHQDSKVAISDLTYFNYTLTDEEIINLFKQGCNKKTALIPSDTNFDSVSYEQSKLELKSMNNPTAL